MTCRLYWWEELEGRALTAMAARGVAVLPVGAVEHHGPHLPFGVDAMILDGVLRAAAARKPASRADAVILPVQRIGWSVEHGAAPGTLSVDAELLSAQWVGLGAWVARAGFRRMLILNSHGGNAPIMAIVAMRLRSEHGILAAYTHWQDLAGAKAAPGDWHAGAIETSVMLHLRPELVNRGAARPAPMRHPPGLAPDGATRWAWMAGDIGTGGVIGDPATATAEHGARLVADAATGLLATLDRLAAADWPPPG